MPVNKSVGTKKSDGGVIGEISSTASEFQEVQQKNEQNNVEFAFAENELTYNYDEPTYYFRWGILPQKAFAFGFGLTPEDYRQKNKELIKDMARGIDAFTDSIVVAETGVTADLNIRSVEFNSVIGLVDGATKGNATVIKMEIFEPFGLSLPDNLSLSANILGIKNWLQAPMHVLELKFKGKKKKSPTSSKQNDTEAFGDCVWNDKINQKTNFYVWRLQIMKLTAKADSGGTVYHLEAALTENFGKDVQHNTLAKMINNKNAGGADTPKKITTFIAEEMTKHVESQRQNGVALPDNSFEIIWQTSEELEKDLATVYSVIGVIPWEDELKPAKDDTVRNEGMGIDKDGDFSWNDGTSIQQIVKDLQASTEALRILMHGKRFLATGKQKKVSIDSEDDENKRVYKYEFRVETEAILKGYDSRIDDYAYHFVFHIVPFAVSLGISDEKKPKTRDKKDPINKNIQKNRIKRFRQSGIVRKRYDYIYTGLNQDVLNFDIDMNLFFFAQVPKATSEYTETDTGSVLSRAKRAVFNVATEANTLSNIPGLESALLGLVGSVTSDVRLAAAIRAGIDPSLASFNTSQNLRIGAELLDSGFINDDVREVIDNTSNRLAQQEIDAAQKALPSSTTDIATAQRLIRGVQDEGEGGSFSFFVFDADSTKDVKSSLAVVGDIDRSELSLIDKRRALIKTLVDMQGKVKEDLSPEKKQELESAIQVLETKVRTEEQTNLDRANEARKQSIRRSGRKQSRFLLDQGDQFASPEERQQFESFVRQNNPALFPLSVKADVSDVSAEGDMSTPKNDPASNSQSLTMAMLNQIYGANALFQTIQLTIRGDPFWIGPGAERQLGFEAKTKQLDPDYDKKQNMLFFQFRLPENYNPETGIMSFSTENMFKGLYIVTTIKHEFKDGKFIQTIDAVRELLTNMLKEGDEKSTVSANEALPANLADTVASVNSLNTINTGAFGVGAGF